MKQQRQQSTPLLHFTKQQPSAYIPLPKSSSVLLSNRLTRSYFSLHDTSLQHRRSINKKQLMSTALSRGVNAAGAKLLQRYHSQSSQVETAKQYHNITQAHIPKIIIKRHIKSSTTPIIERKSSNIILRQNRQKNKFKLLFRESKSTRKTISQRKIDRISRKIEDIELHNRYLSTLVPAPQNKKIVQRSKPRGTVVELERIQKLVRLLIRNISLYFSMYELPKKVGDLLKSVDGYNEFIHSILFINATQAKNLKDQSQIISNFWVSKPIEQRPQYYGQEDVVLFNRLQNYILKMQKSYSQIKKNFVQFERIKMQKLKKQISNKLSINQNKMNNILNESIGAQQGIHKQLQKISEFVDNRKRHNQDRREGMMAKLESLGVRFNVQERSKELIAREKEKIVKLSIPKRV